MAIVYLSLGSNMGRRAGTIAKAVKKLGESGLRVLRTSSLIETAPYGVEDQPSFLNCALECETALSPARLMGTALRIERELGRVRAEKWGPRIIDIDVVFYGGRALKLKNLTVPHYDMHNREFVLAPLCELAPALKHPLLGLTVAELLARLRLLRTGARRRQGK